MKRNDNDNDSLQDREPAGARQQSYGKSRHSAPPVVVSDTLLFLPGPAGCVKAGTHSGSLPDMYFAPQRLQMGRGPSERSERNASARGPFHISSMVSRAALPTT